MLPERATYSLSTNSHVCCTTQHMITRVFGANVRAARIRLGLSQEQLAEISGLHRTYIGAVERAERNITLRNAERIALALKTDLDQLVRSSTNEE